MLLSWDEVTANYELASGERVADKMKVATVLVHAPGAVKDLLHTASQGLRTIYATLRLFSGRTCWRDVSTQ